MTGFLKQFSDAARQAVAPYIEQAQTAAGEVASDARKKLALLREDTHAMAAVLQAELRAVALDKYTEYKLPAAQDRPVVVITAEDIHDLEKILSEAWGGPVTVTEISPSETPAAPEKTTKPSTGNDNKKRAAGTPRTRKSGPNN